MRTSHRARWEWRIFLRVSLISAAISAFFAYAARHDEDSSTWVALFIGAFTSLLIATPLLLYELKGQRLRFVRRLRRLPLALYFGLKVVLYLVVIVAGLLISRTLTLPLTHDPISLDSLFRVSIVFSVVMSLTLNLVFAVGGLLGYSTFKNLLTGRYVQPKREERVFLLIDMKDSTGLAERLGSIRFHELLNDFFTDVTEAALECDAEIHKYVGDEAILTWPTGRALADGECLACPFLARDLITANGERYRKRFGVVPEFRAALHCGEIVTGEIGDVRREIAYVGDTLNVAARLLDATKASDRDVLVSAELLARTILPAGLETEPLPTLTVRGRAAPLAIAALGRAAAAA
jgi:adenylate cyclase